MNNNQNSAGRVLFKLAAAAAIIALILSISRLFLSTSDRTMTEFFTYNLSFSSQMIAFLSVVMISILFVVIGSFLSREYDILGAPLVIGGVLSLIYVTTASYLIQSSTRGFGDNAALGETVLTAVIAAEWLMLVIFTWRGDSEVTTVEKHPAPVNPPPVQPPVSPPASSLPQPPPPPSASGNPEDDLKI